jgi:L-alanine-DL-glutamate epimerase-like enolase superfamily enzyme
MLRDQADLLLETHCQYTAAGAIRLGQELEPSRPLWFEDRIFPDNLLEFAQVTRAVRILLTIEEQLFRKAEFNILSRTGGSLILQPVLRWMG